MQWTDDAVMLSVSRIGKAALLLEIMTEKHGRLQAVTQIDPKRVGALLPGCFLRLNYRLQELGKPGRAEVLEANAGLIAESAEDTGLMILTAIQALQAKLLYDDEPVPELYRALRQLMTSLVTEDGRWALNYAVWEFSLVQCLDLIQGVNNCLADFRHGETIYFAPRSRRAVPRQQAAAFLDRMKPLPGILLGARNGKVADVRQALDLTGSLLTEVLTSDDGNRCQALRAKVLTCFEEVDTIGDWRPDDLGSADLAARRERLFAMRKLVVGSGMGNT